MFRILLADRGLRPQGAWPTGRPPALSTIAQVVASALDMSRTPVREALVRLQGEGQLAELNRVFAAAWQGCGAASSGLVPGAMPERRRTGFDTAVTSQETARTNSA